MFCRNFKEFKDSAARSAGEVAFKLDCGNVDIDIFDQFPSELQADWDGLVGDSSVFLQTKYFLALGVEHASIRYVFATFRSHGALVGVAAFHAAIAESADPAANLGNGVLKKAVSHLTKNRGLKFRVLVLGNSFATGDHGFRFRPEIEATAQIAALDRCIDMIQERSKTNGNKIGAVIVKDFYPQHFSLSDRFSDAGFSEFYVDPNMVMPVNRDWQSFDDYLNALTTKYRTKAKSALKKSDTLQIVDLTADDIETYHDDLFRLYNQVYQRADFRLGKLEATAFFQLKKQLKQCFLLKGYLLDGKLVGFQSGFYYDNKLDAHFVGIDYDYNHSHAVYQRMLYEYIRAAIEMRMTQVIFGRTAMEIKSTVGAFPVDMKCYIRHRSKAPNTLLKILFGYIKPGEFEQRVAFKQAELAQLQLSK